MELPPAAGLRLEADLAALLQTTRDRTEGLTAFHERRAPRYEAQ
jgi:enoyl-CoA hydratase/carnithine racemase